jgi:gamma-glutamyltranspeptidase / glutathione hydrolase
VPYAGGASEFGVRPAALGRRGMVASANPLATQAGLRVLAAGGNAVDAAIATAAAIAVVEPYFSGLGGIGLAVLSLPNGETRTLNFMGRSPRAARPEMFTTATQDLGPLAPMVPGIVAGWARVHEEYGSLSLGHVIEPAIELADRGTPVTVFDHLRTVQNLARVISSPDAAAVYLAGGQARMPGEILRQPGLAETLRIMVADGWMSFYEGRIAETIGLYMTAHGGVMTTEDLRRYPASLRWEPPLSASYRGYEIRTTPPPSSAVQVLQTLRILESFDLAPLDPLGPEYLSLAAEAIRLARVDAAAHVADPEFVDVPVEWMLSDKRIGELRAETARRVGVSGRKTRAVRPARPGRIRQAKRIRERSTTHLAAADASGLAINITQTIGSGYGSGVVIGQTGIIMNNGHHWCTLLPGDPRVIAPDKRRESPAGPFHSFGIDPLGPAHATRGGRLAFMVGTPGSYGIPQTTAQVIIGLVDFGRNIQDAIAAPRFRWKDDVGDPMPPKEILIEARFSTETRKALAARGYRLQLLEDWSMIVGGAQGIVFRDDGWMMGGADPRRNGYAMGW